MTHQLKITIGDTTANTIVSIDDRPIGFIQEIRVRANAYQLMPQVEIIFPEILIAYPENNKAGWHQETLAQLSKIPSVKVSYKPSDDMWIDEIGTDGHIDRVP